MRFVLFTINRFYIIIPVICFLLICWFLLSYSSETERISQETAKLATQNTAQKHTPQLPLNYTVISASPQRVELFSSDGKTEIISNSKLIKVFKGIPPQAFPGSVSDLKTGQQLLGKIAADNVLWIYILH